MPLLSCLKSSSSSSRIDIDDILEPEEREFSTRITLELPEDEDETNDFQLMKDQSSKQKNSSNVFRGFLRFSNISDNGGSKSTLQRIKRQQKTKKKSSLRSVSTGHIIDDELEKKAKRVEDML